MSEGALIDWLRRRINPADNVLLGPGDDAAVLAADEDGRVVVTADAFLEGTHFAPEDEPARIGHKVIAASVSDIAAMGCEPAASFVTLGMSRSRGEAFVRGLGEAMIAAAEKYGAPIAGGDVTSWDAPICVSVTVLGRTGGHEPALRSGAQPGDRLFVTGALGGSLLGKHLDAEPRVREALFLNREIGVSAMIDVSDGLSTDLNHIANESGAGAVVREAAIPISDAARELASQDGRPAIEHALDDGEDFELLFTAGPENAERLRGSWPFDVPVTEIGEITGGDVVIERADGSRVTLAPRGYEHKWRRTT